MNNEIITSLVPLSVGFVIYFTLHSWLASLKLKNYVTTRWPRFMPAYRLTYNIVSVVLLIPLLWLMRQNPGPILWQWQGNASLFKYGIMITAIGGFIWSLRSYDNMVFLGWTQWKNRHLGAEDPDRLFISSLHRFVRHPWYFFILLILWVQDMTLSQLVTYGLITLYLIVGSRLEERKLVSQYGDAYRLYCKRVPGLIPLPWRWLSQDEARELVDLSCKKPDQFLTGHNPDARE